MPPADHSSPWQCPLCGQNHSPPRRLQAGQSAACVRCGTVLAAGRHAGDESPVALALAGLLLALAALPLPLVTLAKFGNERAVFVGDFSGGLWRQGFGPVGGWVIFCGLLAPVFLLVLLLSLPLTEQRPAGQALHRLLQRWAGAVQYWAMPEVEVLAILVAFFKLGSIVSLRPGPGLYCYAGSALFTYLAWRSYRLRQRTENTLAGKVAGAS